MEDIKSKQQTKEEVVNKCMNIKKEIIEVNEQPKVVEKVR
jgi:hypothetical protein